MQLPEESDKPFEINIVPMIDIIFSILAFFIISTLFLTHSEGLSVNLPQASTSQPQPSTEITVTIAADGQIFLNQKSITLENLQKRVRQQIVPQKPTLVIVNADEAVAHGRVVGVMDDLRQIKQVKLAIATTKQDNKTE
ncbi:MAG: biopolymer transporter ExbD [Chloroflexaceae bacterium]|nr:biopolymer transporter ExbD [Chloroflexaceae bacterium]